MIKRGGIRDVEYAGFVFVGGTSLFFTGDIAYGIYMEV